MDFGGLAEVYGVRSSSSSRILDCLQSGQIYKRNLGQNENVFLVQGVINKFIT